MAAAIVAGAALVGLAGGRYATSRQGTTAGGGVAGLGGGTALAARGGAEGQAGGTVPAASGDAASGGPGAPGGDEGARLYGLHCASCHGIKGEGQPNWKVTGADGKLPAPPHDATGHTWHHTDALLLQIIADGGQFYSPNTGMPGFRDTLTPEQMRLVLEHIKGMWGPDERSYQADVSSEAPAAP